MFTGRTYVEAETERLLLNHANTPGFLAPGGEEFNPGPETRLDRSELLCNKVNKLENSGALEVGIKQLLYIKQCKSNL